jgi:hypothetical protein
MRGWLIIAIIGAALLTTPATAQMRAARPAPARVASPASIRSFGFGTTNRGFVPHGFPNTSFGYHYPHYSHYPVYRTYGWWPHYPYSYYGGYYYPWFWDTGSYDQGTNAYYQQYADQDQMYNEVQRLREQQALATAPPPLQPSQQHAQTVLPLPTTLVFQDGKTELIQNYAIVEKTLWVFNERRARKIPVSELNIHATRKVNEDHGVEFSVPE